MALLDKVISEVAAKFGLGSSATGLVREILTLMVDGPGGFSGFVKRVKSAGLGTELMSWVGNPNAQPLADSQIETLFGSTVLSGVAHRLGLGDSLVSTATGFLLPKLIGALTPGGVIPANLPPEITGFLSMPAARADDIHHDDHGKQPESLGWFWSMAAVLALALLAWLLTILFSGPKPSIRTAQAPAPLTAAAPAQVTPPAPAHVTEAAPQPAPAPQAAPAPTAESAPVAAPAPTAAPAPVAAPEAAPAPSAVPALATFSISNENGIIHYSGVVRDEATRQSIINELKAVYGADAIKGDIAVDDHRASAPWLDKLHDALENLKVPGLQALFSGASIHLGGLADDLEGSYLYKYLSGLFGSDWKIGALSDHFGDVVTTANKTAATSLASLKPGFSADDLVGVLNLSILNFPTASAEIGSEELALLQGAANQIKMLPADTVIEIVGYTDNTGSDEVNIPLSQRRADAVRKTLVDAGAAPAALVAKGFGSANPVASNDSIEGRFRNRRIEYRVGK